MGRVPWKDPSGNFPVERSKWGTGDVFLPVGWGNFLPRNGPGKVILRESICPDPSRECIDSLWNGDLPPDWSFLVDAVHS